MYVAPSCSFSSLFQCPLGHIPVEPAAAWADVEFQNIMLPNAPEGSPLVPPGKNERPPRPMPCKQRINQLDTFGTWRGAGDGPCPLFGLVSSRWQVEEELRQLAWAIARIAVVFSLVGHHAARPLGRPNLS